jgi:hypothetical protein
MNLTSRPCSVGSYANGNVGAYVSFVLTPSSAESYETSSAKKYIGSYNTLGGPNRIEPSSGNSNV